MFDGIANRYAEGEEQDLSTSIESCAEDDVADGPPVLEGAEDQDELRDDVDWNADERPDDVDDEERDGFGIVEPKELLEGGDGDEERYSEDEEA